MRKKRIADWVEKLSVAFIAGGCFAGKGFWLPISTGTICFVISVTLIDKGK